MVKKFALKKQEPTESQILNVIGEYLTMKRHFFFRVNNAPTFQNSENGGFFRRQSKFSMNGVPDFILIDDTGHFVGLEIKRYSGKQSEDQKIFEKKCKEHGAEYYIIKNIDELIKIGL